MDGKEESGLTEMTQNAAYIVTTHPNEAYGQGQLAINSTLDMDSVDEEGYQIIPVSVPHPLLCLCGSVPCPLLYICGGALCQ